MSRSVPVDQGAPFDAAAGGHLHTPTTVPLLGLALALMRLGSLAFGGMGTTLGLLRSDLGARRGWITDQDVAEALAITQTVPGSTGVQVGRISRLEACRCNPCLPPCHDQAGIATKGMLPTQELYTEILERWPRPSGFGR